MYAYTNILFTPTTACPLNATCGERTCLERSQKSRTAEGVEGSKLKTIKVAYPIYPPLADFTPFSTFTQPFLRFSAFPCLLEFTRLRRSIR